MEKNNITSPLGQIIFVTSINSFLLYVASVEMMLKDFPWLWFDILVLTLC